jgi:hypothetical protein
MTIDTLTVLKALGEEASGSDGAGTALDLLGHWGRILALINVTVVDGDPPSALDLVFEGSPDNVNWYPVAKAPQYDTPGQYIVPILGVAGSNVVSTPTFGDFQRRPRYLRKVSTVTAGTGGDGVTYSIHLTA